MLVSGVVVAMSDVVVSAVVLGSVVLGVVVLELVVVVVVVLVGVGVTTGDEDGLTDGVGPGDEEDAELVYFVDGWPGLLSAKVIVDR